MSPIAAAVATIVLAFLTGVYVRQTGTLTHTAERQLAAADEDRRLERVKVARVLTEETKRLRAELGKPTSTVIVVDNDGRSFEVPAVHEWVRAIIPDGALIGAAVVGHFLVLDRELHNLRSVTAAVSRAADDVRARTPLQPTPGIDYRDLQNAKETLQALRQEYDETRRKCFEVLDDLDRLLLPVAQEDAGRGDKNRKGK